MKSSFILLLCSLWMFCACSSSDDGDGSAFIEVMPTTPLVYEYPGGIDTIFVNSSKKWTVSGTTDWCTLSEGVDGDSQYVIVKVDQMKETTERTTTLVFSCGKESASVSVKQYGSIETGYVDLSLEKSDVSATFNASTGILSVDYAKLVPPAVRKGQAVVLPAKYGYDIRVIESVEVNEKRLVLQTSQGDMCNLFRNVDFTLATDKTLGGSNAILPSAVGYLAVDGSYHELYNSSMTGRGVPDLFSYSKSFDHTDLFTENGNRFYWEKCSLGAKLKGVFHFKFGEKEKNKGKQGDLEAFDMQVKGNLTTDYLFACDFKQQVNKTKNEIIQQNFAQSYVFRFVVNSVPVVVVTNAHLGELVELKAESSLTETIGFKDDATIDVKLAWTKGGDVKVTNSYIPSLTPASSKRQIAGSFTGKVAYYPVFEFGWYGCEGMWMKPITSLKEEISSEVKTYGDTFYAWNESMCAGVDLEMGCELDFACQEESYQWESGVQSLSDEVVLESPKKIELISPEDGTSVTRNKVVEAQFKVTAYSPVTEKDEPCSGALVVFDTKNGLNATALISNDEGLVTVSWKPETPDNQAVLKARVMGKNDVVIGEAVLNIFFKETSTPGEAVDLGLSVKWSSWNVGATAPEGYGDCFAWGEVEEKADYTWQTYAYWTDLNGDGVYTYSDEVENFGDIKGEERDIATSQWGDGWRMPTVDELKELLDKCTWIWVTQNGVGGRKITGPNGNSIFLPATGYRDENGLAKREGQGYYWTSSVYDLPGAWHKACRLYFCQQFTRWEATYRYWGGFIRPVKAD